MVKVTGPALSLSSSPPLRKPRRVYGAAALPPQPERILVIAGDPAPDPDCTGTYLYFQDYNEHHCYRRTTLPEFFLYFTVNGDLWTIAPNIDNYPEYGWQTYGEIATQYDPLIGTATGYAIASEPFIP